METPETNRKLKLYETRRQLVTDLSSCNDSILEVTTIDLCQEYIEAIRLHILKRIEEIDSELDIKSE